MVLRKIVATLQRVVLPIVAGIVGLGALAVGVLWFMGMFSGRIDSPGSRPSPNRISAEDQARTDGVHPVSKEYFSEAIGTLRAAIRTDVAARILAPIRVVHVTAGDKVAAGDVLIELDRRDMETRVSRAEAALTAAKAAMENSQSDYDRGMELFTERVISEAAVEQLATDLRIKKAQVQQTQEGLNAANITLSYTTITAPQAGTVVDRLGEPGDIAQPGAPLLALYDPTSLRLEAPVAEELAVGLVHGQRLTVGIDAVHREVEAVVDEIVPQAAPGSRTFLVKVKLLRSDGLYEGMFGRLSIPAGQRIHLCLNMRAIQTVGQLQFVDVVDDQGTLERRFIKTGRVGIPGRIEVLSGLRAGERVLLRD